MTATSGEKRDTIVLGASAGGIEALLRLLPAFTAAIDASVFIVQHLPADGQSMLDQVLAPATAFEVRFAADGDPIVPRRVYIAPPDQHMLLEGDRVRVLRGARENRSRPVIDPLFRSAAAFRQGRVMGALLSGLLDDGVAGLVAVKGCGGLAFVQRPDDAIEAEMPERAIVALGDAIDGCSSADALGRQLAMLAGSAVPAGTAPHPGLPAALQLELRMLTGEQDGITTLGKTAVPAPLSCPECGGPLWAVMDGRVARYRCHTGHGYGAESLLSAQALQIEQALWAAIKGLEERSHILTNLARAEAQRSRMFVKSRFEEEAGRLRQHAQTLRDLLIASLHISRPPSPP